ncbi:MAG: hypothetical protein ACRD01_03820 [Terriglobales bacterium]
MSAIHRRVLAFDVRPGRAGFVLLESPHHLVDWGCLYYSHRGVSPGRQAARLIERSRPERIVPVTPANQTLASTKIRKMVGTLKKSSRSARVRVIAFSRRGVLQALSVPHRYAAAGLVAERFPVLRARRRRG